MRSTILTVGNMPITMTEGDLRRIFSGAGKVMSVTISRDPYRKLDIAQVEMASEQDASMAIDYLDGKEFDGHALTVSFAALSRQDEKDEALYTVKSANDSLEPPAAR